MTDDPGSDAPTAPAQPENETSPPDATSADTEPAKKKSTGEHFADLRDTVIQMRLAVDDVHDFARAMSKKLLADQGAAALKAQASILETLFGFHDLLFKRVHGLDDSAAEPDEFSMNLLEALEAILGDRHGIEAICPAEGEDIDPESMQLLDLTPCEGDAKPDTVARVHHCGFAKVVEGTDEAELIRKVAVVVYREIKDGAASA